MSFPHKIGFMKPKGLGFCEQYQAVYNEFTNKPAAADAVIQNANILAIVAGGRYIKSERHREFSVHTNDAGEAQLDWIDPAVNPPVTNVNGCAWDAYNGFTGQYAGGKYINLNFNPTVDGTIIGQNNICLIWGVGNDLAENYMDIGACDGTQYLAAYCRTAGGNANWRCNSSGSNNTVNANAIKHYAMSRNNSANFDSYLNLVKTNITRTSTGLVSKTLYACGHNNNDSAIASNKQLRYATIGSHLAEGEVQSAMTDEETYLDNYGTGLIT